MASFRFVCRWVFGAQLALLLLGLCAFPFAGRLLYVEDPLAPADAVFVYAGDRVVRWLEASELANEGLAPVILLGGGYRGALERRLLDQGVRMPSEGEVARAALLQLGHAPETVRILGYTDNTAEEARLLAREVRARGWRRVIVVTSKLHTRRVALATRRALADSRVEVIVRASRYDDDDPARFWRKRRTLRAMLSELPKLAAYALGLGE